MATQVERDPITTHVLDTTTGLPAQGIHVTLTLFKPLLGSTSKAETEFYATTNSDGRIAKWEHSTGRSVTEAMQINADRMTWSLSYGVEQYYGEGHTFFPQVDLQFYTQPMGDSGTRPHTHVPLLLGPWSYTTYRGS